MNRSTIPNLPKRVLALVLAAALLTPSALASAGTAQINTAQTLADGLVYRNTVSNHSSAGRMESFALELEPDSEVYPIMIQAAGTVYGAATINRAIRTAEELGYTVVGGINSDFSPWGAASPTESLSRTASTSPALRGSTPSPWWTASCACPPPPR